MNYSMATRYELLLLGLISPDDLIKHQTDYIGTERVYSSEYNLLRQVPDEWSCAQYLNPRLFDIYDSEPKRSFITYDFFMNMFSTFAHVKQLLKSGGKFVLVVGTNNIRNIHIDTFAVLVSILEDMGFNSDCKFHYEIIKQVFKITRHSTASVIPHDGVAVMRCP